MLHPIVPTLPLPALFNDPFDYEPHPLCQQAAREVMTFVESQPELLADARRGKMLGVLIVETPDGQVGFLAAYSGLLAGRNDWPFFVPPVFDAQQPSGHFKLTEREISEINKEIKKLENLGSLDNLEELVKLEKLVKLEELEKLASLRQLRKQKSEELQLWLFQQYRLLNAQGQEKDLIDIWHDYHTSPKLRQRFPLPPGGTGDCCAPKLLQYAYQHQLRPVQIAEFWYGESPKGEIRHHGHFYPACRGKCKPVLTHMLQGLPMSETVAYRDLSAQLRVLYEDEAIVVVSKPSGLLSVRGKMPIPSVESLLEERLRKRVMMPHRLDMDTSGLMVVALTEEAYHHLQRQFLERTIKKSYVALVERKSGGKDGRNGNDGSDGHDGNHVIGEKGTITLPLRPAPLDRPRQVVDQEHGKAAVTDYEIIGITPEGNLRLRLTPHTGRTHQLRVHCAHPEGLNRPIIGDNLYGTKGTRLYLHAEELSFVHPTTGRTMRFHKEADF